MKQQLLKKLTDLEHKNPDTLYKYLDCYNDLDYNSYNEVIRGFCRNIRNDTIKEIIEIVEEICPYDEPLHNHHDGCPSCEL